MVLGHPVRCDGVNPGLLGMNKVISEDALRRALTAIPQTAGMQRDTSKMSAGATEHVAILKINRA